MNKPFILITLATGRAGCHNTPVSPVMCCLCICKGIVTNVDCTFVCFLLGNLNGEEGAAERTIEDVFIRRFMFGTFHGCLANEIVIKRRGNLLLVCALMLQKMPPQKFYFLIGYSESLLSHFYKCPVKLEIQTLQEKAVYKYI